MTLNEAYPDWQSDRGVFSYLALRNHYRDILTDEYIIRSLNGLLHGVIAGDFECSQIIYEFQKGYNDAWQTYISDYIYEIYHLQWYRAYNAIKLAYDTSTPYNMENTTTNEMSSTSDSTSSTDSRDNTFAYNANDMSSPTDESTVSTNNNLTDTSNSSSTTIAKGSMGTPMPDLINKELELARYSFYREICMDLKKFMTLDVVRG